MPLLVTPRGDPAPPADINRCLHAISPRLSLRWLPMGGGCWAVMCQWSDVDRRRETVRQGLTTEENAADMLVSLPPDCSVADAVSYFERACYRGEGGSTQQDVRDTLSKIRAWNDARNQEHTAQAVAYAEEIAPTFAKSIGEELGNTSVRVAQREPGKRKHLLPQNRAPGEI